MYNRPSCKFIYVVVRDCFSFSILCMNSDGLSRNLMHDSWIKWMFQGPTGVRWLQRFVGEQMNVLWGV